MESQVAGQVIWLSVVMILFSFSKQKKTLGQYFKARARPFPSTLLTVHHSHCPYHSMHKTYATEKADSQLKCINVKTENLNTKLAYFHCISFCYPFPCRCWMATRVSSVRLPVLLPFMSADKCNHSDLIFVFCTHSKSHRYWKCELSSYLYFISAFCHVVIVQQPSSVNFLGCAMHEFLFCFRSFTAVYEVTRKGGSNLKGVLAFTIASYYSTGLVTLCTCWT